MVMESKGSSDVKLYNSSLSGDIKGVIAALLAQEGRDATRSHDGGKPLLAAALKGHPDIFVLIPWKLCSLHQSRKHLIRC